MMKYISLLIGGILVLSACTNVKVDGNGAYGEGALTAGFRDTTVTIFENAGTESLEIDLSRTVSVDTKIRIEVCEENNIRENESYLIPSRELLVKAGEKSVKVEYSLIDDNIVNGERSFSLQLLSVNGGVIDSLKAKVNITVLDDESDVAIGFKSTEISCREREIGSSSTSYTFNIPVELLGNFNKPLQYKVALYPLENENTAIAGTHFRLTETDFPVNSKDAVLSIPVEIIDNDQVNADRIFALEITEVSGGKIFTNRKRCTITIINDDLGIYFRNTAIEVEEIAGTVKIPVKTMGILEEDLVVKIQLEGDAVKGSDYSLNSTEYILPAGKDSIEVEINILHPEVRVSPDRTLRLRLNDIAGAQIFGEGICDIRILDCDSKVSFEKEHTMILNDSTQMSLPVILSEALEHDVTFQVNVNTLIGLTEDQVTLPISQLTIPAGETSAAIQLNLKKLNVKNKANFKVNITKIHGATTNASCIVSKYYKYQTTDLKIESFSSEEINGENAPASNAIDGNTSTFWHSHWDGTATQLPQGLVISLPDHVHIMALDVIRRIHKDPNQSDNKTAEVYLNSNVNTYYPDEAWGNAVGSLKWPEAKDVILENHTSHLELNSAIESKYLKIKVTEGWKRSFAQIAEIIVYGYSE